MRKWVVVCLVAAGLIAGVASYAIADPPCPSPPCVGVDSVDPCPISE